MTPYGGWQDTVVAVVELVFFLALCYGAIRFIKWSWTHRS